MTESYEIMRRANITDPDGSESVFYEIHTIVTVDGVETRHRNMDVTFKSREKAEEWLAKQA